MNRARAFTLIELLVVIAIIGLLFGLILPALAKAQGHAKSTKDAIQIKQIHQAFLSYAAGDQGRFPTPGRINREAHDVLGEVPGLGAENYYENTSANLYSALLAQEYFNTALLIGPTEVNPVVQEDRDYDFSRYDPGADEYWDRNFQMHIHALPGDGEANCSYAHMGFCGARKSLKWRDTRAAGDPVVSTRGVGRGLGIEPVDLGDDAYTRSPTLLLHGPRKSWVGNICFNDNHGETVTHFYPRLTTHEDPTTDLGPVKDNIFAAEFDDDADGEQRDSADAWLVIAHVGANGDGAFGKVKWDRLLD